VCSYVRACTLVYACVGRAWLSMCVCQGRSPRVASVLTPGVALPLVLCRPYIMDLQSTNGTFINGERIPDSRYVELKAMDCVKFGSSSREYVLLHDKLVA
jgi:hypothetical protein